VLQNKKLNSGNDTNFSQLPEANLFYPENFFASIDSHDANKIIQIVFIY
jgi:hypothetical protein